MSPQRGHFHPCFVFCKETANSKQFVHDLAPKQTKRVWNSNRFVGTADSWIQMVNIEITRTLLIADDGAIQYRVCRQQKSSGLNLFRLIPFQCRLSTVRVLVDWIWLVLALFLSPPSLSSALPMFVPDILFSHWIRCSRVGPRTFHVGCLVEWWKQNLWDFQTLFKKSEFSSDSWQRNTPRLHQTSQVC